MKLPDPPKPDPIETLLHWCGRIHIWMVECKKIMEDRMAEPSLDDDFLLDLDARSARGSLASPGSLSDTSDQTKK